MKISYNWLKDYISIKDMAPSALAERLTAAGIEVESIDDRAKNYKQVVIGHILERKQHPAADRLTLCQVTTGQGVVHQIVCGATNHKQGDNVVVALPGAVLPGDFAIKLSKIRGVESQGMLCSEKELGLSSEGQGILILPADAPVGQPFADYAGLSDVIFELKVTPNRADCLSHFGLARELSTLFDLPAQLPLGSITEAHASAQDVVQVRLEDADLCPRYAGRVIRNVKVGPSPEWLKQRLRSVGMNSINNIVDITNFVMMELGQPMHAFDLKEVQGGAIRIGKSKEGEKFTTLDGTELKFSGGELVVGDAQRTVALAGIVGGKNSGVLPSTTDIFLESAFFRASQVRKTSRHFGIETESSYRFSRGVDPEAVVLALNRGAQLIQSVAGGEILTGLIDQYPKRFEKKRILVNLAYASERLGYSVESNEFEGWMRRLGASVERVSEKSQGEYQVLAPGFRHDIHEDVDLVEEFARLAGYDRVPLSGSASTGFQLPSTHDQQFLFDETLGHELRLEGYDEVSQFYFGSSKHQLELLGGDSGLEALAACGLECGWSRAGVGSASRMVQIKNPLNEDFDVMRVSLVPGLVQTCSFNSRHENHRGALYEIGPVFEIEDAAYMEEPRLGMILWGEPRNLWSSQKIVPQVLQLKQSLDQVFKALQGRNWRWDQLKLVPPFLHPNQSAGLFFEGQYVGYVGTLHPNIRDKFEIRSVAAVAEISLARLMSGQPRSLRVKAPSKFPPVERDLAFVVPRDMTAQALLSEVAKVGGAVLQSAEVFDVFQGPSLGNDKKSVAIRVVFQDHKATLSEVQVQELHSKVIQHVTTKLGVEIR